MATLKHIITDRAIQLVGVAALLGAAAAFAAGFVSSSSGAATDAVAIPQAERHWVLDEAPLEQQAALQGLQVAREEYVAAIAAERKCLTDQGIWVSDTWWEDNQLRYTFGGVPTREEAASVFEIYRACHMTHVRNIATAWAIGSAPAAMP